MLYELVIQEEAVADMKESYDHYEQQQAGLGERFLSAVQDRFTSLSKHPEYYSFIDDRQLLRDVTVDSFPYVVIYAIIEETVKVYAVHATHMRPKQGSWK